MNFLFDLEKGLFTPFIHTNGNNTHLKICGIPQKCLILKPNNEFGRLHFLIWFQKGFVTTDILTNGIILNNIPGAF